jgi:hypothetical protein
VRKYLLYITSLYTPHRGGVREGEGYKGLLFNHKPRVNNREKSK